MGLGIATIAYLTFCFFNLLDVTITFLFAIACLRSGASSRKKRSARCHEKPIFGALVVTGWDRRSTG